MLTDERLATACLLTVVGTDNAQRVVIERTPTQAAQRWAESGKPLVATNDYRMLLKPQTSALGEIYETTCMRYEALTAFFADHKQDHPVEDAALLYILSDPPVIQSITAQHVLMRPASEHVRLWVPRHLLPQ